jgi:hypothetical protein
MLVAKPAVAQPGNWNWELRSGFFQSPGFWGLASALERQNIDDIDQALADKFGAGLSSGAWFGLSAEHGRHRASAEFQITGSLTPQNPVFPRVLFADQHSTLMGYSHLHSTTLRYGAKLGLLRTQSVNQLATDFLEPQKRSRQNSFVASVVFETNWAWSQSPYIASHLDSEPFWIYPRAEALSPRGVVVNWAILDYGKDFNVRAGFANHSPLRSRSVRSALNANLWTFLDASYWWSVPTGLYASLSKRIGVLQIELGQWGSFPFGSVEFQSKLVSAGLRSLGRNFRSELYQSRHRDYELYLSLRF